MQYHALQVASNNSLDRYVSHQNSPMISVTSYAWSREMQPRS